MLTPENIDALVRKVMADDRESYRALVECFEPRVRGILAAVGPDRNFIQDLCQEVFMAAYLGLGRYVPGTNFGAWISQITRNLANEEVRRRMREARRVRNYGEELRLKASLANLADEKMESDELIQRLRRCVDKLPEQHGSLVKAVYFDNLEPQNVAETFGRPVNWLRVALHRIRRQLLICMEEGLKT